MSGVVGYTQYALGIPETLVAVHILGAASVWAAVAATWFRARPLTAAEHTISPIQVDGVDPLHAR